jgi:hypothetical protein
MFSSLPILAFFIAAGSALTLPVKRQARELVIKAHDAYSSSIGVLGCKINTDRVAYFPDPVSCDDICVKVSANGRSVFLLRIDRSGGSPDISYDAFNFLQTGQGAEVNPQFPGSMTATVESAPISNCLEFITEPSKKLAFIAANSEFATGCPAGSFVRENHILYNIRNPTCSLGFDEVCQMPPPEVSNQATCPHILGAQDPLTTQPVFNIAVGTGLRVLAP